MIGAEARCPAPVDSETEPDPASRPTPGARRPPPAPRVPWSFHTTAAVPPTPSDQREVMGQPKRRRPSSCWSTAPVADRCCGESLSAARLGMCGAGVLAGGGALRLARRRAAEACTRRRPRPSAAPRGSRPRPVGPRRRPWLRRRARPGGWGEAALPAPLQRRDRRGRTAVEAGAPGRRGAVPGRPGGWPGSPSAASARTPRSSGRCASASAPSPPSMKAPAFDVSVVRGSTRHSRPRSPRRAWYRSRPVVVMVWSSASAARLSGEQVGGAALAARASGELQRATAAELRLELCDVQDDQSRAPSPGRAP